MIAEPALFALTVLVLNATPGVDMALMTASTLQQGARAGLATALGISLGCVLHTLAAAFGLAALLAASAEAFTVLKWAGAAYLLWLALGMLRQGLRADTVVTAAAPARGIGALVWQGFWTNALNPKIALFFLALLPPFIAADAPSKPLAFLLLGAWFVLQGGLFALAFVALVAQARKLPPRPGLARGLHLAGAGLFAFLAARLALARQP